MLLFPIPKNRMIPCACLAILTLGQTTAVAGVLRIGWAAVDITPDRPVAMRQGAVSAGVQDPITATVLAMESGDGAETQKLIMISCDLQHITDGNRYPADMLGDVRSMLRESVPELKPENIIMLATHTHVAPSVQNDRAYGLFAAARIATAAAEAWQRREPGGISHGLGQAVTGHNRIATYRDGSSHMVGTAQQGSTANPEFSHIEGFEDHSVHLLYTWDEQSRLTGVVINVACPAQVQRGELLSADYWHEVRELLRARAGPQLFILPQISAAGDLATTVMVEKRAEDRMQELMFPGLGGWRERRRQQIALRIADAVTDVLPYMQDTIAWTPELIHTMRKAPLPGGFPDADASRPRYPVEIHAVRIGDVAMVTNPFELYLDYGVRIKGRSPAIQTFVVQLAGSASYLPTRRAVAGGGYGAIPETCIVGPAAGDMLVELSLLLLNGLWDGTPVPDDFDPDDPIPGGDPVQVPYGYPKNQNDYIDTGDFMGLLHARWAPWVYSPTMRSWGWMPGPETDIRGAPGHWIWVVNP
jgi:hypothetical protein